MGDSDQTIDPKTGKIYRKQSPKERSVEFIQLRDSTETARLAVVAYCNEKSYTYDIRSGRTFRTIEKDGKPKADWVKDRDLDLLVLEHDKAKKALKAYKEGHKADFQPPVKKGRNKGGKRPITMKVVNKPSVAGNEKVSPSSPPKGGKGTEST